MRIPFEHINASGKGPLFIAGRKRLATVTSVAFIDRAHLVAGSLVGQRLYLIRFDEALDTHQTLHDIPTECAGGPGMTDLIDFNGRDLLVTSNCYEPSVSLYRLTEGRLSFVKTVPINDSTAGFCHGARFVPPDGSIICATTSSSNRLGVYFISVASHEVLYKICDGDWRPKDVCFLSPSRVIVLYARGRPTPDTGVAYDSKVSLVHVDLEARRHRVLDELVTEDTHVDCCGHLDGRIYVNDQSNDRLFVARLTGDALAFDLEIGGYDFPHGLHLLPGANLLAVTNYGNNTIVIDHVPPLAPPLHGESSVLAVVTHHQCESWLAQCLESLAAQTRPPDAIVVLDDASPVPPVDIVRRFPQVTLLASDHNVGPYRLLQALIDRADYDAFLMQDADDWSAPDRLERLLAAAARSGAELVGCQPVLHFEGVPAEPPRTYPADVKAAVMANPIAHPLLLATSVLTRDLVQRLGGLATGMRYSGDSEFIRRAVFAGNVTNIPEHAYHRRVHPASATRHPETGYDAPVRREIVGPIRQRSRHNVAAVTRAETPDLAPFAVAGPVTLKHVCGPPLREQARPARLTVPSRKAPVFIVGMHRSGTSMAAHLLRQAGLWMGAADDLHGPTPANPEGHWEPIAVTQFNDALLNDLGGGWDSVPPFATGWLDVLSASVDQARQIQAAFERPTPWGWKDPRASLLMPFWLSVEPAAQVVICVRNPLEVAESLRTRGLMSYALGLQLWRAYYERLLADVSTGQRLVVHYEHFFARPRRSLTRMADFCGLRPAAADLERIAATINPRLRHTHWTADHLIRTGIRPEVISLYAQLCDEASPGNVTVPLPIDATDSPRHVDLDALSNELFLQRWPGFVRTHTFDNACVAVVSKGDDALLLLQRRTCRHFPADDDGQYTGYHPADDHEAVARLEAAVEAGAEFLAIPVSALWWLSYYPAFRDHLENQYTRLASARHTGVLYDLRRPADA